MVEAYWNIGREIVEEEQKGKQRAEYGAFLVKDLSLKLSKEYGRGFDQSNLWNMCLFYKRFPILDAVRRELSWTHYRLLLKIENTEARSFYINECLEAQWSTRQLERQINSFFYERLLKSKNKKLVKKEIEKLETGKSARDIIKDPYVLEFLDLKENQKFLEKDLERAILDNLQNFLLELGKGFAFVSRQKRITAEGEHFYIDLVFYNYILKCFFLVDLKVGKLTHQDIGQMDFYVRFFEDKIRAKEDNPAIGLILCAEKNVTVVKYSVLNESKQVFASKYKLFLPTEYELKEEINRERHFIESNNFSAEKYSDK